MLNFSPTVIFRGTPYRLKLTNTVQNLYIFFDINQLFHGLFLPFIPTNLEKN